MSLDTNNPYYTSLSTAQQMIKIEIEALECVDKKLGTDFLKALELLDKCKGKVVVTGLGKSGIAGKKIAATLASTGEPAFFLHAAEAGHGDLGVVTSGDVVIAISYSGETSEVLDLIPRFKLLGVPIIALTGNTHSNLAKFSDCVIDVSVPQHSWPFGLIPTASNVAAVAIGDAFAVSLITKRNIKEGDFALLHPSGLLGRKLLVKVRDLMHTGEELPVVFPDDNMRRVLMTMTYKRLGVACVLDESQKLLGIFTDGDVRRLLERNRNPLELKAKDGMTKNPKTTQPDELSASVLHLMEQHSITSMPVIDENNILVGLIHMHDIIKLETNR